MVVGPNRLASAVHLWTDLWTKHAEDLGSVASVSLATARSLATEARQQLDFGQDPIEAKRDAEKEAAASAVRAMTFRECAEAYMAAHEPTPIKIWLM